MFLNLGMMRHGGFTLTGAIHTSGIYPSPRLSESYVGQCWTPDQGGVYRVAGSGYGQVRGAKLATTVAEGAILGPELFAGNLSVSPWGIMGATTGRTAMSFTTSGAGGVSAAITTAGRRYKIRFVFASDTTFAIKDSFDSGFDPTITLTNNEAEYVATKSGVYLRNSGAGTTTFSNISIREVIPVWIAPDTYPTRSIRTRFGSARVPTSTSVGMVSSPAMTNKVTCRKTNPTDLTNLTKSGDAASVLSVVDDTAALAAAGLSQICSSGKVYKLDNSAGSTTAYAAMSGATGNTNGHSLSAYCRATPGVGQLINAAGSFFESIVGATYKRYYRLAFTPPSSNDRVCIAAPAGSVVYFICPELVESSYLPADPIVPLTAAADTAAAFTRAAIYMEEDTAGVFPTVSVVETLDIGHVDNPYATQATRMSDGSVVPVVAGASWAQNFAVFGTCVPDAVQSSTRIFGSYVDASNYLLVTFGGTTGVSYFSRISATSTGINSSCTHAANAPFDYLAIQTIHGMAIRVRPHATMTWGSWATNVTTNGKKPAPLATKYQIGALGGANSIAGKHPKVSIYELGNQASLTAYQDRAMLLAGRITG